MRERGFIVNRSKYEIQQAVLKAADGDGVGITAVMNGAKLSHEQATRYLGDLMALDMVASLLVGKDRRYKVTAKGKGFLKSFERLQKLCVFPVKERGNGSGR